MEEGKIGAFNRYVLYDTVSECFLLAFYFLTSLDSEAPLGQPAVRRTVSPSE